MVGSHEFYLGYAINRGKLLCLDTGHCHPTEEVADKLSAVIVGDLQTTRDAERLGAVALSDRAWRDVPDDAVARALDPLVLYQVA